MFIIYSKQTGLIQSGSDSDLYTSIKDMYPVSYVDYEIVYDCMNVPLNEDVLRNMQSYKVDLETKEIVPINKQYTLDQLVAMGLIKEQDAKKFR